MKLIIDIPDNAIKFDVSHDDVQKHRTEPRYKPGYWNGLNGGIYYGQYFDMDDVSRIEEMIEIASLLKKHGINYNLSKLKRRYRIAVTKKDYLCMDKMLKNSINAINEMGRF